MHSTLPPATFWFAVDVTVKIAMQTANCLNDCNQMQHSPLQNMEAMPERSMVTPGNDWAGRENCAGTTFLTGRMRADKLLG
jgi:hypothetical protein